MIKPHDWHGFPYYAMYSAQQRRCLVRMDRFIIRLVRFTLVAVPTLVVIGALIRHA